MIVAVTHLKLGHIISQYRFRLEELRHLHCGVLLLLLGTQTETHSLLTQNETILTSQSPTLQVIVVGKPTVAQASALFLKQDSLKLKVMWRLVIKTYTTSVFIQI